VSLVVVLPSWRPELFHTIPDGRWPPGVDKGTPPTRADELVDGWMSGDLPDAPDYLAPNGSEIRLLGSLVKGNLTQCTLRGGACSAPVRHRTVHEIWDVLEGYGELWRKPPGGLEGGVVSLWPGIGVEIPTETSFQFRATGADPLRMVLLTMPSWPGATEAILERVGRWSGSTTAG
jgi:mannose-6-phosphate isomerase-like protein (cupin superfamily)